MRFRTFAVASFALVLSACGSDEPRPTYQELLDTADSCEATLPSAPAATIDDCISEELGMSLTELAEVDWARVLEKATSGDGDAEYEPAR